MGKDAPSNSNSSADLLAQIGRDLYSQTNPLRQGLTDRFSSFISSQPAPVTAMERLQHGDLRAQLFNPDGTPITGNSREGQAWDQKRSEFENLDRRIRLMDQLGSQPQPQGPDVTNSPQFASLKDAIDRQFSIARNNVLATTPAGGALSRSLTNLEGQRAGTTATGIGNLYDNELNRAFSLATGSTPQAMSGLGSAGAIQAQLDAANQARQSAAKQGLGTGLGYIGGMYLGGPVGGAVAGSAMGGKR